MPKPKHLVSSGLTPTHAQILESRDDPGASVGLFAEIKVHYDGDYPSAGRLAHELAKLLNKLFREEYGREFFTCGDDYPHKIERVRFRCPAEERQRLVGYLGSAIWLSENRGELDKPANDAWLIALFQRAGFIVTQDRDFNLEVTLPPVGQRVIT